MGQITASPMRMRRPREARVRAFDLLGAIGLGKTALIERMVPLLSTRAQGWGYRGRCLWGR